MMITHRTFQMQENSMNPVECPFHASFSASDIPHEKQIEMRSKPTGNELEQRTQHVKN
jgi:hypothetical protein